MIYTFDEKQAIVLDIVLTELELQISKIRAVN